MGIDKRTAENNASLIAQAIDRLENRISACLDGPSKAFWDEARSVVDKFKTHTPLFRADRQTLWQRHQAVCERYKAERKAHWDELARVSREKRRFIEYKIDQAHSIADGADGPDGINRARERLAQALEYMKDGWSGLNAMDRFAMGVTGSEGRLLKQDRALCWERWQKTRAAIDARRDALQRYEEARLRERIRPMSDVAAYGDPYEALRLIKAIQGALKTAYLSKMQRDLIRSDLDRYWQLASGRIRERKAEKARRHQQWRCDMQAHIARWTSENEKDERLIARLADQISNLQIELAGARTAEFADKVRGWIEEKYAIIQSAQGRIRVREEKIRSVTHQLNK